MELGDVMIQAPIYLYLSWLMHDTGEPWWSGFFASLAACYLVVVVFVGRDWWRKITIVRWLVGANKNEEL